MSILGRKVPGTAIAALALLMLLGALLSAVSRTPEREISLVARGMAFYLESDPATPNPTITVRAGERVRVVLRNEERGIVHDFAVPSLAAALDPVRWSESGAVMLEIPEAPGTYEYVCRPHQLMMRGVLRID